MTIMGTLIGGAAGGLMGAALVFAAIFFALGSLCTIWAINRSRLSDRLVRRSQIREILRTWADATGQEAGRRVLAQFKPDPDNATYSVEIYLDGDRIKQPLPDAVRGRIDHLLHTVPGCNMAHHPDTEDLNFLSFETKHVSAHRRMEAHGVMRSDTLASRTAGSTSPRP